MTEIPGGAGRVSVRTGPTVHVRTAGALPAAFGRVHYAEEFRVRSEHYRTALEWARVVMEDASATDKLAMANGWRLLGLRTLPPGTLHVAGWAVRSEDRRAVDLAAHFRIGLRAVISFETSDGVLAQRMFVHFEHPGARLAWKFIGPRHRRFVTHLLRDAVRRAA